MDSPAARRLIHRHSFAYLLVVPVLLAIATGVLLWMHSDLNLAMLYSQCHARSRLYPISRIPGLGAPVCFVVSFFQEALDESVRATAAIAGVLAFFAGLLTVSTVESARICNRPNLLIAYPTGAWLVFNLMGGAFVWELVIVPAFFHRSRELLRVREEAAKGRLGEAVSGEDDGSENRTPVVSEIDSQNPNLGAERRNLNLVAEVFAIPVSVAVGFVAPSIAMLVSKSPIAIGVWLFSPVYVSLIRQALRWTTTRWLESHRKSFHLESHSPSLALMYALPVACSLLAHVWGLWVITALKDDRRSMTRSATTFIEIDTFFVFLTVLYWILIEAGWRVALVMAATSVFLGPGAGVSLGWIYREQHVGDAVPQGITHAVTAAEDEENSLEQHGISSEQTPLLGSTSQG